MGTYWREGNRYQKKRIKFVFLSFFSIEFNLVEEDSDEVEE